VLLDDVAETVPVDNKYYGSNMDRNQKRFASRLTREQLQMPLMQSILKNSGGQEELPDPRALLDVMCFENKFANSTFTAAPTRAAYKATCNQFRDPQTGKPSPRFQITNHCNVMIVDYTLSQYTPRGWLVNICPDQPGGGRILRGPFAAAQGRGDGPANNHTATPTSNAADEPVSYVSNTPDTNTTAGGFFVAAQKYTSNIVAMNMQGVERGFNDNACDRRTVVHNAKYVADNIAEEMSKGCISLSDKTNQVVRDALAGPGENKPGKYSGGGLIYSITPAERANLGNNCGRNVAIDATAPPVVPHPRPIK